MYLTNDDVLDKLLYGHIFYEPIDDQFLDTTQWTHHRKVKVANIIIEF
jgi:hypothetical protein